MSHQSLFAVLATGLLSFGAMGCTASTDIAVSPLDAVYKIEGREVRLVDGRHEEPAAPGSAAMTVTVVAGRPAFGDLDGDGVEDAALFISSSSGGSGTFFYVAAAIRRGTGYIGADGILLGDRIAPRTLGILNGVIMAGYDDRRPGEPMAAPPTASKSRRFVFRNGKLVEVTPEMTRPASLFPI